MRVLVVDDDTVVLQVVAGMLRRAGYAVATAEGGNAALRVLACGDEAFDLLLTDVVMPDLDGPALARECRRLRPEVRVLYMSGYTNLAAGDTIFKPFRFEALVDRVEGALAG